MKSSTEKKTLAILLLVAISAIQQWQLLMFAMYQMLMTTFAMQFTKRKKFQLVQVVLDKGYYYRQPRKVWMKIRSRHYWKDLLRSDEEEWIQNLRMTSNTFLYICDELGESLKPEVNVLNPRKPISAEEQIAICLYFLASGANYRVIGCVFGIHKSTVCKIVNRVCNEIVAKLMPKWITIPNEEECKIISQRFEVRSGIPQIILAIDGSHIPITPPSQGRTDFFNRKGWPSLVLQAAVDDKLL